MILSILLCMVGFLLLYFGAEWLVSGSSSLGKSLGITPIVIGLTIVAFGTSAPELVVSLVSSIKGNSMIAIGNVVGSNICNIALVLGMATVLQPLTSNPNVLRRDVPIMLGISMFVFFLSLNSIIGRLEGMLLFLGVISYTFYNYFIAKKEKRNGNFKKNLEEKIDYITSRKKQIFLIIIGIAGVVSGAELVVDAAKVIMKYLGVSEKFIGLTIIAFGTSLPELATSVIAAIKKEMDISIGNLVGSNVFNLLSVIGAAAMLRPIQIVGGFVKSGLIVDYLVMIFVSLLPWIMLKKDNTITRLNGIVLLTCYFGYLSFLISKA